MNWTISPTISRIAWIGTGVMGTSMCRHLLQAGYRVTVFSRTRCKAQTLEEAGAIWADSPAAAAANADVVFSIVGYPADVADVHLGSMGTLSTTRSGTILVDMTTSSPALANQLAEEASKRNTIFLDAPVSGGDIGARNATLSIMVGGERNAFEALHPIWSVLGKTIVHQGPPGAGQHTKMTNQILIATNMIGVCESLLYAYRAGLDLETVLKSVASGAAGSWSLSNLGPRIIQKQFDPGFFVDHFVKDMGIALDEANRMRLALPGLALAKQLYVALQAQGGGHLGTHALQLALAKLSGIEWGD
jgi:3-hydroxyisobutyrate dehydrogenase